MQIPDDVVFGQYYLGVIVDELDAIEELDDNNNTWQIPITIVEVVSDRTPTPAGPTPTPIAVEYPAPKPLHVYTFDEATLEAAGFDQVPGGFGGASAGEAWVGDIPVEADSSVTDGQGAVIHCRPGEVQLLMAKPLTVGNVPVIIRMAAKANSGEGQLALVALDGSLDGSIATLIPSNTKHMVDSYKRMSLLYEPTTTDTLSVVVQLYVPATASESVTINLDNIQVIPFVEGTRIGPAFLKSTN